MTTSGRRFPLSVVALAVVPLLVVAVTMLEVDPVTFLPAAHAPVLFQFAESDQFVNQAAIDAWTAAAPGDATTVETYDWNHSLRTEAAGTDRDIFLTAELGLGG